MDDIPSMVQAKIEELKKIFKEGPVAVGFSGSLSSTILVKMAEALSQGSVAITVDSPFFSSYARREGKDILKSLDIRHIVVQLDPRIITKIGPNTTFRYYYYLDGVISAMKRACGGHTRLVIGAVYKDTPDHESLKKVVQEYGILAPFLDEDLPKKTLHDIAHMQGIEVKETHSMTWLGSRIPYGMEITSDALSMIDRLELFLLDNGIHHSQVFLGGMKSAIITVSHKDMKEVAWHSRSIRLKAKKIGFDTVSVQVPDFMS